MQFIERIKMPTLHLDFMSQAEALRIDTIIFCAGSSAGAITAINLVYTTTEDYQASIPNIVTNLGPLKVQAIV